MDVPVKLGRKYRTYVPTLKKSGAPIDWEALARSRNFFDNSAHEMFRQLYADTEEDFKNGKYSIVKLAAYLNVCIPTLTKALKEYGFHVSSNAEKSKYNNRNRSSYAYPHTLFGFDTEWGMWVSFIENSLTAKQIIDKIYDSTGRCFLPRIVSYHYYLARKRYEREKKEKNT